MARLHHFAALAFFAVKRISPPPITNN